MATKAEIHSGLPAKISKLLSEFWAMSLIFFALILIVRGFESYFIFNKHALPFEINQIFYGSFLADINWTFYFLGLLLIVHVILSIVSISLAKWTSLLALSLAIVAQAMLSVYFFNTLNPLGKDLLAYNLDDIKTTVGASGMLNFGTYTGGILGVIVLFTLFHLASKYLKFTIKITLSFTAFIYLFLLIYNIIPSLKPQETNELKSNIQANKSKYLTEEVLDYYLSKNDFYFDFYLRSVDEHLLVKKEYLDSEYPFLHQAEYPDVFSPFFDSLETKPNLVFILIEGLGKSFSGDDALLGSFTPFLDSLSAHSLVWNNAISTTGRTFGLLPGVFAGLPYGKNGFLEMYDKFPHHHSLFSVLQSNGYKSHFYMGTDINFDNENSFLKYNQVESILDIKSFDSKYPKISSESGFSWGYNDKELFSQALEIMPQPSDTPRIHAFQTITSHNPYKVPNPEEYQIKFDRHVNEVLDASEAEIEEYEAYKNIYYTILYADDAVKAFIKEYQKRTDFENTIFIITGDHRLPEIPMASRIDRFHVPFIVYSPLLKRTQTFKGITSHFEVTPTLLSFLHSQNEIRLPEQNIWLGQVMDTSQVFQSLLAMPLMRNKNQLVEYISGTYFLSDEQLYMISDGLNIDLIDDEILKNKLIGDFQDFKNKNNYTFESRLLLPLD